MGLRSRLIGYAVVGLVAFNVGSCMAENKIADKPTTPQLYTMSGEAIEDVNEPLYCMDKSEVVQYESLLEIMVER